MLKAFVRDHGWNGAEIIFFDSKDKAVEYFRKAEIECEERRIAQHDVKQSGQQFVDLCLETIERVKSSVFEECISEYEILDGASFHTDGEY